MPNSLSALIPNTGSWRKVIERTRELSDTLDEIQIINKRKTDFVSAVSHELRTPDLHQRLRLYSFIGETRGLARGNKRALG